MTPVINFISKDEESEKQILHVRHLVMMITTVALAVYIVAVAGVYGWWWYQSSQKVHTSSEIDNIISQIKNYSDAEVVARRLAARTNDVANFINQRGNASDAAQLLVQAENVEVTGWMYVPEGNQQIKIKTEGPGQIFAFSQYLKEKYDFVQPDEIGWSVSDGWYGRFLASSRKKGEI